MIGLDSNILLRALTDDDPVQSPKAREVLARLTPEDRGYINLVVLAEVAWSLVRKYRAGHGDIQLAVETLLNGSSFEIEAHGEVAAALDLVRVRGGGFNDALIGMLNRQAGCPRTLTFDQGAPVDAGFAIVE